MVVVGGWVGGKGDEEDGDWGHRIGREIDDIEQIGSILPGGEEPVAAVVCQR